MDLNEYQKLAMRTMKYGKEYQMMLCEGAMGISGEAGEVSDYIKKYVFHDHKLDAMELAKELGDVMWYVAMIATTIDLNLEDVAEMNIEKLKRRYPEGFDSEKSIEREEVKVKIRKDIVFDIIGKFRYQINSLHAVLRIEVSPSFLLLLKSNCDKKRCFESWIIANYISTNNIVEGINSYKIYGIMDGKEVLIIGDKMPNTL